MTVFYDFGFEDVKFCKITPDKVFKIKIDRSDTIVNFMVSIMSTRGSFELELFVRHLSEEERKLSREDYDRFEKLVAEKNDEFIYNNIRHFVELFSPNNSG